MSKSVAAGLVALFAFGMSVTADAATTQTITITKKVVKVTHEQCVMARQSRAKTDAARMKADKWCRKRGDTIPRRW